MPARLLRQWANIRLLDEVLAIAQPRQHHLHNTSSTMSEAVGTLAPGQRLSLTGSAVPES